MTYHVSMAVHGTVTADHGEHFLVSLNGDQKTSAYMLRAPGFSIGSKVKAFVFQVQADESLLLKSWLATQEEANRVQALPFPSGAIASVPIDFQDYSINYAIEQQLTPQKAEAMAEIAAACLETGDLHKGLKAIALAVAVDSARPDWKAILDEYIGRIGQGHLNIPINAYPWTLLEPITVYANLRNQQESIDSNGRPSPDREATAVNNSISRLLCHPYSRRKYFENWVLPWLDAHTIEFLGATKLNGLFGTFLYPCQEGTELTNVQRQHLLLAHQQLSLILATLPFDHRLHGLKVMTLRKLGHYEEAIAEAITGYKQEPGWHTAVAVANAARYGGNVVQTIRYLVRAARHDQTDVTALLDLGDIFLEAERWHTALKFYERSLAISAKHKWATPSAEFCRYKISGDKQHLRKLKTMVKGYSDSCGVDQVLSGCGNHTRLDRAQRAFYLLGKLA